MDKNQFDDETIAPGMNTHDEIEEKATNKEVQEGESSSATHLYLDRTPED
ncbi:hypothetical protein ACFQI7_13345 [Paenibacillus allorhizosphaerae]|uniref:DUF4025 domain-containing protein n=1 Tax=Paenibacillus allorhizosphaerae TaxID=2849866 RepID=A0ABN7TRJ2_9BACL|nr:hypothetical protein [Paenibacillus allorhizosphaerae]CAG7652759.1 hypothetical protein PAECIP111802_05327 [Paenibacillus allorhizosphaerae]